MHTVLGQCNVILLEEIRNDNHNLHHREIPPNAVAVTVGKGKYIALGLLIA
jgi:hypothetical protein